jgi:glycosyltransferase involved in cell wall biosynthesis
MPVRLLFLNTADRYGADVAVHVSLMKNFAPSEAEIFVLSNSEAADVDQMRALLAELPHVTARFLPFGRPLEALTGRGKAGKALAFGPSAVSLMKAVAFIKRHRIQIVHCTDRPRDASFASALGFLTGTASVVHMHSNVGSHITRPALWGMHKAKAVIGVSDFISRELTKLGLSQDKVLTVHNAVDADYFDPDSGHSPARSIREQFGIPSTVPLVGIAARMTDWKGHREMIGAVASLRGTHPDLHVLILGTDVPEFREDYLKRAREGGIADGRTTVPAGNGRVCASVLCRAVWACHRGSDGNAQTCNRVQYRWRA